MREGSFWGCMAGKAAYQGRFAYFKGSSVLRSFSISSSVNDVIEYFGDTAQKGYENEIGRALISSTLIAAACKDSRRRQVRYLPASP